MTKAVKTKKRRMCKFDDSYLANEVENVADWLELSLEVVED